MHTCVECNYDYEMRKEMGNLNKYVSYGKERRWLTCVCACVMDFVQCCYKSQY